jgi:alpha-beta hydrolase superfamily lysophospholipase
MEACRGDGIFYRIWRAQPAKAVFLLVHGLGAHGGRWQDFADFFSKNGFSSYALELEGFGRTNTLKGHVSSFKIYFEDIDKLCRIIAAENKGKKIFLLGESMGGLICFLRAAKKAKNFAGLICISPAFSGRINFRPADYAGIVMSLFYNPKKQFCLPFDSAMITRDALCGKKIDEDPKECRLATSRLLFEIITGQFVARFLKKKIKLPVLFLLAGCDKLTDPAAAEKIFKALASGDKALRRYPEGYHALSVDAGREKVFEDILKWTEKRT